MERRKFMAGFAALSAGHALRGASPDGMIYCTLGKTGEKVSAMGSGPTTSGGARTRVKASASSEARSIAA